MGVREHQPCRRGPAHTQCRSLWLCRRQALSTWTVWLGPQLGPLALRPPTTRGNRELVEIALSPSDRLFEMKGLITRHSTSQLRKYPLQRWCGELVLFRVMDGPFTGSTTLSPWPLKFAACSMALSIVSQCRTVPLPEIHSGQPYQS